MVAPLIAAGARVAGKTAAKNGVRNASKTVGQVDRARSKPKTFRARQAMGIGFQEIGSRRTNMQSNEARPSGMAGIIEQMEEERGMPNRRDMSERANAIRAVMLLTDGYMVLFIPQLVAALISLPFLGIETGARHIAGSTASGVIDQLTGLPPGTLFLIFHLIALIIGWILTGGAVVAMQIHKVAWFNTVSFFCLMLAVAGAATPGLAMAPWGLIWAWIIVFQHR